MSDIIELLLRTEAVRFGSFTLKDGRTSPVFVDIGQVSDGPALRALGRLYADAIVAVCPHVTHLFGPAYKGIPIATATATALAEGGQKVRVFFDRKEQKTHGEGGNYFGAPPNKLSTVVLLDDVVSSGLTKVQSQEVLMRDFGVKIAHTIVAVDRRSRPAPEVAGLPLLALTHLRAVAEAVEKTRPNEARAVYTFLEQNP